MPRVDVQGRRQAAPARCAPGRMALQLARVIEDRDQPGLDRRSLLARQAVQHVDLGSASSARSASPSSPCATKNCRQPACAQRAGDLAGAQAIGVGLDHGGHLAAGRSALQAAKVRGDRAEVDGQDGLGTAVAMEPPGQ